MQRKWTENAQKVIENARGEAIRLRCQNIESEHLLLSMLRIPKCSATELINARCKDVEQLKKDLELSVSQFSIEQDLYEESDEMSFSEECDIVIKAANIGAIKMGNNFVNTFHLFSGFFFKAGNRTAEILKKHNINNIKSFDKPNNGSITIQVTTSGNLADVIPNIRDIDDSFSDSMFAEDDARMGRIRKVKELLMDGEETINDTPFLNNFGKNLTEAAKNKVLDPVVGREKEIDRICQVLSRRKKNNPILIGEPGVGKSSIAEGLAIKIASGDVPYTLSNKIIYTLDLALVVAGTKYRGQFEERIKGLIAELEKNRNIILFIDEIHTIAGAGNSEGGLDASNIFKPALARGEIQCIGATTLEEYRKHIESDGALERRFQK
ncbi:MAG: ATP-dependent Clp protease ATP-binding subunit, partial [Bacteroidales bacterium]|nr:ATP-dependent Clp protease ATP-binding subunit [Bacteroidales bacterium]